MGCVGAFALSGCLSNNYQVSREELLRLARTPPEQRGEHVRVLQQTSLGADDVGAEPEELEPAGGGDVTVNLNGVANGGGPGPHPSGGAATHSPWQPGGAGHAAPVHVGSPHAGVSSGGHGGGGGGFSLGGGGGGNDAIVEAIVAVVIANGVGVALAVTEGRRFEGWARVDPEAGIFLISATDTEWLPLSALTEDEAKSAQRAVLVDHGERVHRLARAPLDRQGLAYEVELGAGGLNTVDRTSELGFACRSGVGYFPTPDLGFLFVDQVAFGEGGARLGYGAIFNGRLGAEVEYLPVRAGRFHAGFYAELGGALVLQDLPDKTHSWSGAYTAGGFLTQIDWTTRLAVDLRAGIASLPAHPGRSLAERSYEPELTLGVAVY